MHSFYRDLYSTKAHAVSREWFEELERLPDETLKLIERDLKLEELEHAVFKKMKCGKSPGNDGLTPLFYRTF